jgi:sialic acid synthase SpsE
MTLEIVAELSCNHLGSLDRAKQIVHAAADAGADLFKVQVWSPDTMCVSDSYVLPSGPWAGRNLRELYREAWTPWEWLPELFALARDLGMEPFGAAFDRASVDYLESLGVKRHKVASFELVDLPLIRYMASYGKPMILSTGMATWDEVFDAYGAALRYNLPGFSVTHLKCTSAYPADATHANLRTYGPGTRWGLSDHTMGIGVACAAAALGAVMIEKHLTLSRADGGPDAGFSMEPHEFKQVVVECRRAAAAVGTVQYGPSPGESTALRRSLWVVKDTVAGQPLVLHDNVETARPALGLPCDTVLVQPCIEGYNPRRASRDLKAGQPLTAADML